MADKPQVPPVAPMLGIATTGEVVIIFVGPEKKRYNIHKDIICHHSEYFRAAFNGRWKEADEGVTLEDVDIPVFNVFVHWIYTQEVPGKGVDLRRIANLDGVGPEDTWAKILLQACAFGNRFLAPEYERISHNRFVDGFANRPYGAAYKDIIFAYENLPEDSRLLQFLVEMQSQFWQALGDDKDEEERRVDLPKEFLIQVMVRQAELRTSTISVEEWNAKVGDFYMQEKTGEVDE